MHKGKGKASKQPAHIYPRGKIYYCWYYDFNGKRICESTHCTDEVAATEYLRQREREARNPDAAAQAQATLKHAFTLLIVNREELANATTKKGSKATVGFYQQKARVWYRIHSKEYLLKNITPSMVDTFISKRRGEGVSDGSIHKELVTLRAGLKLARRAGIWVGDPAAILPVGFSDGYEPRQRWIKPDELPLILKELYGDWAARAAYSIALGAEWAALENAMVSDLLDEKSNIREEIRVRGTKHKKRDRIVHVVTDWQRELLTFVKKNACGENGKLLGEWNHSNSCRTLKRIAKKLGIEAFSWNDLRRTYAQWKLQSGVSFESLYKLMGHTSSKITQKVYANPDDSTLRAKVIAELRIRASVEDCSDSEATEAVNMTDSEEMKEVAVENVAEKAGDVSGSCGNRTHYQRIKSPTILLISKGNKPHKKHWKEKYVAHTKQSSKTTRKQ